MFHWCVICCQGFLSLYLLGAVKNRGEIFKFFVKGDLNVFRVALSPDDWTFCDSWCFLLPKHFYFPQLFPGSILLPPVIGVDAPPPIYSGREWWKRTKNTQTSNTTLCVCTVQKHDCALQSFCLFCNATIIMSVLVTILPSHVMSCGAK